MIISRMDSVNRMKLPKILKNRKAMTPLMIGIIVAASIVAVLFIVMAAVIPAISPKVELNVKPSSVMSNSTTHLSFQVICDFDHGNLTKIELYKDQTLYSEVLVMYGFNVRDTKTIDVNGFTAASGVPASEISLEGFVIFQVNQTYTLRLYYQNIAGGDQGSSSFSWTYT